MTGREAISSLGDSNETLPRYGALAAEDRVLLVAVSNERGATFHLSVGSFAFSRVGLAVEREKGFWEMPNNSVLFGRWSRSMATRLRLSWREKSLGVV